jgi:PleD family two-component response regulator
MRYFRRGIIIAVTIPIGISTYQDTTNNIDNLLEYADMALYKAKKTSIKQITNRMNL